MIKNYLKTAWRSIKRNKVYSFINIGGLAIGIAFSFLIGAYIHDTLQVNGTLKNANDQYIILSRWGDDADFDYTIVGNLAKQLKEQYPGLVANYYRWDGIKSIVSKGDKHFRESIQINDSTFFPMYNFPVLYGDTRTALNDPFSAVITEDIAKKYFGQTNVIGRTLTLENFSGSKHDFLITAVLKDMPVNSVTKINENNLNGIMIPASGVNFFNRTMDGWNTWVVSYVELQKGISPMQLDQPMRYLIQHNTSFDIRTHLHPKLVSLNNYYLTANNGLIKKMLYTLSFIAVFILLMAIVNFVNISISNSSERMKEIGVRKVIGGMKKQLVLQFLVESILLVLLSTLLALIVYQFARPYLSNILGKEIPSVTSFPFYMYSIPFALAVVIGLLAGIYPALILSSLKPVEVLKGKFTSVKENILLRKSLVAFQFCIAAIVLTGSIIISKQVNYFFSKDLGYDKEYMLSVQLPRDWSREGVAHMETIRNEFSAMPEVSDASLSYEIPDGNNGRSVLAYQASADSSQSKPAELLTADENYATAYKIPLLAGSFFNTNGGFDSSKIVINETFAKSFGWNPNEAINKQIKFQEFFKNLMFTISGVVKDFHFGSMQNNISPVVFANVRFYPFYRYFSFRIKPGSVSNTITALQKKWAALMPGTPFEYNFMDDTLAKLYKSEIQLKKASYTSTVLSIIIALLGILGLISLSIQKRTKEIGIRKVLGSSVAGILTLFIKEFLTVILIGGLIACPLVYMIMHNWLQGYAYRINITATPFIISIVCLGLITALVICLQSIKAAIANPVKSLRTE